MALYNMLLDAQVIAIYPEGCMNVFNIFQTN